MQGRKHLITNQLFKKLNVNLPGPTKQRCVPQVVIYDSHKYLFISNWLYTFMCYVQKKIHVLQVNLILSRLLLFIHALTFFDRFRLKILIFINDIKRYII